MFDYSPGWGFLVMCAIFAEGWCRSLVAKDVKNLESDIKSLRCEIEKLKKQQKPSIDVVPIEVNGEICYAPNINKAYKY